MTDDTGIETRDLGNKTGVIILQNTQAVDYLESSYVDLAESKNYFWKTLRGHCTSLYLQLWKMGKLHLVLFSISFLF